jgi:hypothetical protein
LLNLKAEVALALNDSASAGGSAAGKVPDWVSKINEFGSAAETLRMNINSKPGEQLNFRYGDFLFFFFGIVLTRAFYSFLLASQGEDAQVCVSESAPAALSCFVKFRLYIFFCDSCFSAIQRLSA